MGNPTASDVEQVLRNVKLDNERLIAFAWGYMHGAQDDATAKTDFEGPDEFHEYIRELYREQYPDMEPTI